MTKKNKIYFVRHFKPQFKEKALLGHTDPSLESDPPVLAVKALLPENPKIYSSDLKRAYQTASLLYPGQEIEQTPLLREINFGDFEGATWPELEKSQPKFYSSYMDNWLNERFPNGESTLDLIERVKVFLGEAEIEETSVIFCHAGTIRVLYHLISQVAIEKAFSIKVGYGEVISVDI